MSVKVLKTQWIIRKEINFLKDIEMKPIKVLGRVIGGLFVFVLKKPELVRLRGPDIPPEPVHEVKPGEYYSPPFLY